MDGGPPYARIAAELGARSSAVSSAGPARPLDAGITGRWGVAMATATKVLAALRQDGLVHRCPASAPWSATRPPAGPQPAPARSSEPRDRDGPDPRRPGPGPARIPVAPDRIVAAAIRVADAEGLAALSMRRVAAEIGAAPMSLYRHVADKDDLVVQMMNTVFARTRLPDPPPDGWRPGWSWPAARLWAMFAGPPVAGLGAVADPAAGDAGRAALHRMAADRAGRSRARAEHHVHRLPDPDQLRARDRGQPRGRSRGRGGHRAEQRGVAVRRRRPSSGRRCRRAAFRGSSG